VAYADPIERRSMSQHLERLIGEGTVREIERSRYVAG